MLPDILHKMALVIAHPDEGAANKFAAASMWKTVGVVAPMLLGMMIVGLLVNVAQVGFKPTSKKLKPDFSRLNVFKGIKKMVGMQTWWELGKALAKTGAACRRRVARVHQRHAPRSPAATRRTRSRSPGSPRRPR